jgi:hypothetical protein
VQKDSPNEQQAETERTKAQDVLVFHTVWLQGNGGDHGRNVKKHDDFHDKKTRHRLAEADLKSNARGDGRPEQACSALLARN